MRADIRDGLRQAAERLEGGDRLTHVQRQDLAAAIREALTEAKRRDEQTQALESRIADLREQLAKMTVHLGEIMAQFRQA